MVKWSATLKYILIGSAGVFAMETNLRAKRKADRGQSSADVPMMEKD
jgi:hypothetical protein